MPELRIASVRSAQSPLLLGFVRSLVQLTKPRLCALNAMVAAMCAALNHPSVDARLWSVFLGVFCTAGGASAINMVLEADVDKKMLRTQRRPIPTGRVTLPVATAFGFASFLGGFAWLWIFAAPICAWLSAVAFVVYTLAYTPLKRFGFVAVWVGAIAGAMPALIGAAAFSGHVDGLGWAITAALYVWQFPHFLALAWLAKDDYARAGLSFVPKEDVLGRTTARRFLFSSLLLVALCLSISAISGVGTCYASVTLGVGLWLIRYALLMVEDRRSTRRAFFATLGFVPIWLFGLIADQVVLRL